MSVRIHWPEGDPLPLDGFGQQVSDVANFVWAQEILRRMGDRLSEPEREALAGLAKRIADTHPDLADARVIERLGRQLFGEADRITVSPNSGLGPQTAPPGLLD